MNEPIETDKDGNTLTLMDTMSAQEDIVEQLDGKMRSEQLRGYLQECLSPRWKTSASAGGGRSSGDQPFLRKPH